MTTLICPRCGAPAAVGDVFCTECGSAVGVAGTSTSARLPAVQDVATQEMVGRACPYCRFPLKEGAPISECGVCRAVHHAECFGENGGCAIAGCAGGPASVTAAMTAVPATRSNAASMPAEGPLAGPPPGAATRSRRQPLVAAAIVATLVSALAGGAAALVLTSHKPPASAAAAYTDTTPGGASAGNTADSSGATSSGNSGTGNSATGNSGTGNSGTGNSGTGNSATGNSATGNSGTGNSGSASPGPVSEVCFKRQSSGDYLSATPGNTCTFAENTFYEYYKASGGDGTQQESVNAWSPQDQQYYSLTCSPANGVVDCNAGNGGDIRFTQHSVSAYTAAQASAYAASAKLGPNG